MMKKVLITGANQGIGLETARQLLEKDFFVFIGCRNEAKGEEAATRLIKQGYRHLAVVVIDVTDNASVQKAFEQVNRKTEVLDILINNAGIRGAVPQQPSTVPLAQIKEIFETNFFGVIRTTQTFLPMLKQSSQPRIVNVTSDLASLTRHNDPSWKYYHFKGAGYGPSKSALNAYTVSLAYELRDTLFKVNAVNPGHTATAFNNYGGTKSAEDAAEVIVKYALLDDDGPTGKFFSDEEETPW
jgi:NAD(P)-dependent dehydrogenase (short-subunit alcohol dehydrogenase family)